MHPRIPSPNFPIDPETAYRRLLARVRPPASPRNEFLVHEVVAVAIRQLTTDIDGRGVSARDVAAALDTMMVAPVRQTLDDAVTAGLLVAEPTEVLGLLDHRRYRRPGH
jgi:hypothetical protein